MTTINSRIPEGPVAEKWTNYKAHQRLVNPKNKLKLDVIVVGTGLAGASAAASLGEMGFNVLNFCIQDSPRRAHSIAAQGGINAAKNYQNDGDSVYRLFYDTVKGGDYRAREANVYRLAEVSNSIIDQCVAQGVPFAREYGGTLANRSFGGAQVSRTFYAKGQTGQQLLLGAYSALSAQVNAGKVKLYTRYEMQRSGDRHRWIWQHLLPLHQRHGLQRDCRNVVLPQGRLFRQPLLRADSPNLYSCTRRQAVEAHTDVGISPKRRTYLGTKEAGRCKGTSSRYQAGI